MDERDDVSNTANEPSAPATAASEVKPAVAVPEATTAAPPEKKKKVRETLLVAIATLVFGAVIGAGVKAWTERGVTDIVVTELKIEHASTVTDSIPINANLIELATKSAWGPALKEKESLESLTRHKTRLERVRNVMRSYVGVHPTMMSHVQVGNHAAYRQAARQLGTATLSTISTVIISALRRGELQLVRDSKSIKEDLEPHTAQRPGSALSDRDKWIALVVSGIIWNPEFLKIGLEHARTVFFTDVPEVDQLVAELAGILQSANSAPSKYLFVSAIINNSGGSVISFYPYAVIVVDGVEPLFLKAKKDATAIVVEPGKSVVTNLISDEELTASDAEKLVRGKEQYQGSLMLKASTKSIFSSQWVTSRPAYLGTYSQELRRELVAQAKARK